jgi:cytochrome c biogenesis protein CcdA
MIEIFQAFGTGLGGALGAPMLPLLPAFLAWAYATRAGGARAAFGVAASFAAGFALLNGGPDGLVAYADFGAVVAGLAIAAFGLQALGALRVPNARIWSPALGFALAFGWAPLPGPALAAAAESGTLALAAHGAGLAVFAWLAIPVLGRVSRGNSSRQTTLSKIAGLTLFATGLAIAAGLFAELGFALDENFPALRVFG